MLFLWFFVNFINENILFSDIEWEHPPIKTNKYSILKVVFAIWNPLIFDILELWGLNQLDRALDS